MALPFYKVDTEAQANHIILTIGRHLYDGEFVWGLDSRLQWRQEIEDIPEAARIVKELMKIGEPAGVGR
jgi:hypothetical protein